MIPRNTAAYATRYSSLAPYRYANHCCAGTRIIAPSTGPHTVPAPPRNTGSTDPICTSGSTANCG